MGRRASIPDAYTLALERGVPIGGIVRDEQGRPIAGARVFTCRSATTAPGGPERYATRASEIAAAVTDDQGRWRSEALPASAGPGVRLDARDRRIPTTSGSSRPSRPRRLRKLSRPSR